MRKTADPPAERFQFSLQGLFALITTVMVALGLLAWIAPYTGMGNMEPMLLLFFATWFAISAMLCCAFARTAGKCVLIAIAMLVVVYASFALAIHVMIAELYANPPPRPMFHNFFGEHERVLLPYWHAELGESDSLGNLMWADHADNVVVIVLNGAPDHSWTGPDAGQDETRFAMGDGASDQWVRVQRTTNALVVIGPYRSVARFPLPPNVVADFHEKRRSHNIKSLILDVGLLLDADNRTRLDSFVADAERSNRNSSTASP